MTEEPMLRLGRQQLMAEAPAILDLAAHETDYATFADSLLKN
jgi:hypothetical protein